MGDVVLAALVIVSSPALLLLLLVGGLAAGYLVGRARPWVALRNWCDWRMREDGQWWMASTPRQVLIGALFVLTWPRGARYAWQHRNDSPVTIREGWPADGA